MGCCASLLPNAELDTRASNACRSVPPGTEEGHVGKSCHGQGLEAGSRTGALRSRLATPQMAPAQATQADDAALRHLAASLGHGASWEREEATALSLEKTPERTEIKHPSRGPG